MIVTLPPRRIGQPAARVDVDAFPPDVRCHLIEMARQYHQPELSAISDALDDLEVTPLREGLRLLLERLYTASHDAIEADLKRLTELYCRNRRLIAAERDQLPCRFWDAYERAGGDA